MVKMIHDDPRARRGQLLLIAVTGTAAALVCLVFNLGGKPGPVHFGILLLVGGLVWLVWEGVEWARWVLACLFLLTAIVATSHPFTLKSWPTQAFWCFVVAAASLGCSASLASAWVRHYQTAPPP